eukprot:12637089-Ditylum_brightwellii.AAC.1
MQMLNPIEMQLVSTGANINATDQFNCTLLHYAFFPPSVDTKCVSLPSEVHDPIDMLTALSWGKDMKLDIFDEDNRTPLHYAASVCTSLCVSYLCKNAPSVMNTVDKDTNNPLALALRAHRADTAVLLISKGSYIDVLVTDVSRKREKDGKLTEICRSMKSTLWHALNTKASCASVAYYMLAAKKVSDDTIVSALFDTGNFQLVVQHLTTTSSKDHFSKPSKKDGMTLLHRLAQVRDFSAAPAFAATLADLLIKNGVNASTTCLKGRTAIFTAAYFGHKHLLDHLQKSHCLDVDAIDTTGGSPLT